jgi:rare lipoprotein A
MVYIIVIFTMLICSPVHAFTASWYGTTGDTTDPWKHTTTANGEHFNENALTAASWKYPLGSYVKVTNLRNHKSVIVRINDRGPGKHLYKKGRIIDLTRGSFQKIADLNDGVIKVKVVKI